MKMYVQINENGVLKQVSRTILDFVNANGVSIAIHEHPTRNNTYVASEMTSGVAITSAPSKELCKKAAIDLATKNANKIKNQSIDLIYKHLNK